ncbi:WD40 repeat domain-containing protein, partial [Hamadaea tsunoensis]|uniref:hypothetical protein n=1 Tax=Hamadaea tsunoensis TaxID=53368 RepID=UPI001B7FE083
TPLTGHTAPVHAVACTTLNGQPIAVTGGRDATIRFWSLTSFMQIDLWPSWDAVTGIDAHSERFVFTAGWDLAELLCSK